MVENEARGINGWYWQESIISETWRYHQSIVYRAQKLAKTPGASCAMKERYYCRTLKQISINLLDLCPFLFITECGAGVSASAYKNIHSEYNEY